jgi:sulfite oxidase
VKDPSLIVHSTTPYNAEPPLELLRANFVTPRELFYVRNHGNIPEIDPAAYRLIVDGWVERPLELELDRLLNDFPKRTVMATLQCAGNRRSGLMAIAPIPGEVPWEAGAIGNAFWSGIPLKEILSAAGVKLGAQYVALLGADEVLRNDADVGFGASIPLDKAQSGEVLLAYEMNGQPLAPVHGYPLRVLAPGYIGARSVKWLARITVQPMPSQNYFQAHAYQLFPPQVDAAVADWNAGLQLGELAVNCVICSPREGELVEGPVTIQGYALSGGGRKIARVDVSTDRGASWTTARLTHGDQPWAWSFWEAQLKPTTADAEIIARAFDTAANTQPEDARHIWNFKGYMNNAWHRTRIRLER